MTDFKSIQKQWAQWLRNSEAAPQPDADQRRLAVYRRLVHNNIESFIERGFPVLESVLADHQWQQLMADFIANHHAKGPLFSDIGREFVSYLQSLSNSNLPDYVLPLARYERMELDALYCETACVPPVCEGDFTAWHWSVNPSLVWHEFNYPVHTIRADNLPQEPLAQTMFLAVYRVDTDPKESKELHPNSHVKFMQLNAVTMLLIDVLQQQPQLSITELTEYLAEQLPQFTRQQLLQGLEVTIPDLYQRAMLFPSTN